MSRISKILLAGVATATIAFGLQGMAAAQDSTVKDVSSFTCKDIMRATDDRDAAISFLHGYFLGKKGTTDLDTEKLAEATDKFIEYCLDNPSKGALAAMGGLVM